MYGTLTDAELLGGVPHGGTVLDDIGGQFAGPLLDVILQDPTRSLSRYAPYICRRYRGEWGGRAYGLYTFLCEQRKVPKEKLLRKAYALRIFCLFC